MPINKMGVNFNVASNTKDQRSICISRGHVTLSKYKTKNVYTLTYTHRKYTELANI